MRPSFKAAAESLPPTVFAEQLGFSYPPLASEASTEPLLHDLSLSLGTGQALMVMGASGSGKSTLCYVLAGLAPLHTGGERWGTLRVLGSDVAAEPPSPDAVALLFQDAATQLFSTTVENEVAWGLETLAVPSHEIGPRVLEALQRFGLLECRYQPPWKLSGGQQKRLTLAALWSLHPRLFLLDEPLGGVDPAGRAEVLSALNLLRGEGTTLLFTTPHLDEHWQDVELADAAALLEEGQLSVPEAAAGLRTQEARLIVAGLRCPSALWEALHRYRGTYQDSPAIEIHNLRSRYLDGPPILHGIDLTVPRGQFVALVGANGAGKTTLVRHLNGLLRPVTGSLRIMGQESAALSVGQLARDVGFLFQRPERQIFGTTVREEVAYGPRQLHLPDVDEKVARVLDQFGLARVADWPPAILSYGAQRSVTLAALAALETPILVLDEPTVGLDGRGRAQLLSWLVQCRAKGTTIILVTHEMRLAAAADRVITLEAGRIVDDSVPEDLP